ncbi:MAG: DUF4935 domain-containing protein [Alphaproteobacteria bacterium]|nr:DUF4935 domain-containing protein [Alphaproteobacteria bacterium]
MRDYLLIEGAVQTFLRGCRRSHISVYFSEIVLDELVGNFNRDVFKAVTQVQSLVRKLERMGVRADINGFDVTKEVETYRAHLRQMMEWTEVKAVPYPDVSPKELVAAAYAGKKPFKDNGEGFKDHLIFQSLRQLARAEEGPGYFVTANVKDFCANDGTLHPDLRAALPENCMLTVFENLHDFNAKILVPQLEALDGIATHIRDGEFDGFDLTGGLTDLFIAELCDKYNPLDETGTPLDEPSVESVGEAHVAELDVSRLDDDQLLIELSGRIELELSGFIQKNDFYLMDEHESEDIYVSDPDWNDHVMRVSTSREFHFDMTVVFDEPKEKVDSVTIEIRPLGDMEGGEGE